MWDILLMIGCVLAVILCWFMLYDGTRFVIRRYVIRSPKITAGYRAVVLADLHNKRFGKNNQLLLQAIEEQKPDAIWIAGDILTARPGKSLEPATELLRSLAGKYPIYYANGNHEHRIKLYPETYGDMAKEYGEALEELKIQPLVNTNMELPELNMVVYGAEIDREYYRRFVVPHMEEAYLAEILGKQDEAKFNVLLAHNPDYFPVYAEWGADLVLSGHVHGGMVRIPGWKGVVSPNVRFFPKYDGGKFEEGKSTMILSRGLGMHTIPVRLFNPGELIVIEIEKEQER